MKKPRFKRTRKSEDTEPNKLNAGNIRHPKRDLSPGSGFPCYLFENITTSPHSSKVKQKKKGLL